MTTLTSATWRRARLPPEASSRGTRSSESRRKDLNGRNVRNAPINVGRVEGSVQTSVEVRVEGAGARWERNSANDAEHKFLAQRHHLDGLTRQRPRLAHQLERSQQRLHDAQGAVDRISDVEASMARRSQWLVDHPAELRWEADLADRLGYPDTTLDRGATRSELPQPDDDLAIDLRTIDISPHQPRSGLKRRLHDAIGITRHPDPPGIALPPPPSRGIDGPDLGL